MISALVILPIVSYNRVTPARVAWTGMFEMNILLGCVNGDKGECGGADAVKGSEGRRRRHCESPPRDFTDFATADINGVAIMGFGLSACVSFAVCAV